jgi:large subunit ribosomal protein L13
LMEKFPTRAVEKAIKGMLPKNSIGKQMASKLKVYAGPNHPHGSQGPIPYVFTQIDQMKVGK